MLKKIKVFQIKSSIGCNLKQKSTLKGLGLFGIGTFSIHDDTPSIRGMIKKIIHMVKVNEIIFK